MYKIIFILLTYLLNFEVNGSWFIIPDATTTGLKRLFITIQSQSSLNDDLNRAAVAPSPGFVSHYELFKAQQDIDDLISQEDTARSSLECTELLELLTVKFLEYTEYFSLGGVFNDDVYYRDARG